MSTDRSAKIRSLIQTLAKNGELQPGHDESLFESGLLDSFSLPDLISGLEQEFNVKIPDSDLSPRRFDTIARIEAYLDSRS